MKKEKGKKQGFEVSRILHDRSFQTAAALFLIAFALRFYYRSAGLWHTDSVLEAEAAEQTFQTGRLHYLMGLGYPAETVIQTIMYAFSRIFLGMQTAEFSATFTSIFFGALGVAMIYFLARKLSGKSAVGIYSGIILTFLPVYLVLSTYAKNHTTEAFFIMATVYAALVASEKKDWQSKLATSLLLGWTIGLKQTNILLLPILLLFYWRNSPPARLVKSKGEMKIKLSQKAPEILKDVALFTVPALIVFVSLFVPRMFYEPGYSLLERLAYFSQESSGGMGFNIFSPLMAQSIQWTTVSLTLIGWALMLLGFIVVYLRQGKQMSFTFILWFFLYFVMMANSVLISPRFFIPALIPAVMLIAYSLDYVSEKLSPYLSYATVLILIYMMFTGISPVLEYRKEHCGPCEFAKKIGELVPQGSIVLGMDEGPHYKYYAKLTNEAEGTPSSGDDKRILYLMALYRQILRNGTQMYITTQGLGYDTGYGLDYNATTRHIVNKIIGKEYENLLYDTNTKTLYDTQYQTVLPLTGKYGISLFDTFKVTPILQAENEDWHHSDIELARYTSTLYKIELRGNSTA
ncbi:MAG: glycosyltransferase family 39 protein [Candidatus Altiarchaeota archaeon]|nr:glycosyltransferase family 39 protein [Candidatus Altiarchaeota archaeon]